MLKAPPSSNASVPVLELLGRGCTNLNSRESQRRRTKHTLIFPTGLKQNKFGVLPQQALALYLQAAKNQHLEIKGIDCHIGSQINQIEPLLEALTHLLVLVDDLENNNITIEHIDLGGGMGISYQNEIPLDVSEYGQAVAQINGQ